MVLDIPGHTAGHAAYYGGKLLFCGDTLWARGRGRWLEGTPAQMWSSLYKLVPLPQDTPISGRHHFQKKLWRTAAMKTRPPDIRFAGAVDRSNEPLLAWEREGIQ